MGVQCASGAQGHVQRRLRGSDAGGVVAAGEVQGERLRVKGKLLQLVLLGEHALAAEGEPGSGEGGQGVLWKVNLSGDVRGKVQGPGGVVEGEPKWQFSGEGASPGECRGR